MAGYRKWIALGLALSPALWLSPLEQRIHAERVALKYGGAPVTVAVREKIGQGMAIGLLAGFRSVVADFLWIQNNILWESLWRPETDKTLTYIRMHGNMSTVVTLQPRSIMFWENSAWHMGWNIAYAAQIDPKNRTEAEGRERNQEWRQRARAFLEDGIRNNPDHYRLHFYLGFLYLHKLDNPCMAADYFLKAAQFPDVPSYPARLHAIALERCGRPAAAYDYWKQLWRNGHPPKFNDSIDISGWIQRELRRLEALLNVPNAERVFPVAVGGS